MTRIVKAELQRLVRRRTVMLGVLAAALFAVVATPAVFSSVEPMAVASRRGAGVPTAELAGGGGGTQAFAIGAAFTGFLVFVNFIGLMATEFSGGTFRALVLRDPHRLRLITGKLTAALIVAAGIIGLAEAFTFASSLLAAPGQDISTGQWFTLASAGEAVRDFATVLAGVTGWAVFGTTLAVVFRSAPLALGVGFAWAGPFENIIVDSWATGLRVFPGQVLASLIRGGTVELGVGRAAVTAAVYAAIAAVVALTVLARRDVTA